MAMAQAQCSCRAAYVLMPSRLFMAAAQCMLPSPMRMKCVSTPSAAKACASAHRLGCFSFASALPSNLRNLEHRGVKQLLHLDAAVDQSLLVQILGKRCDLAHILLDAIGPVILAHECHGV